jgi:RNA polymerase sigma factor (sigma-70 family)
MNDQYAEDRALALKMQAAQAGDTRAYAELLKFIAPRLRQIIRSKRKFLQAQDVEDIVQDVLLSLHAVRATYDPERPFIPWLMAITHNRLVDAARRYARHGTHESYREEEEAVTFFAEDANVPDEAYGDPEALKRAIRELPSGQREAIEMLKLRQMTLKEASAASGLSIGALKVSVHRAMSALRRRLTKV